MAGVEGDKEAGLEDDDFPVDGPLDPEEPGEGGEPFSGGDEEEEDDVDGLASFLESEILSGSSDEDPPDQEQRQQEEEGDAAKNKRKQGSGSDGDGCSGSGSEGEQTKRARREEMRRQAKDLQVPFFRGPHLLRSGLPLHERCRVRRDPLAPSVSWLRYCMRWGLGSNAKFRECPWKNLYIQRDREDMVEFVRNTPTEFKEYYIQMQAAKRSQVPRPSEVNDDKVMLDKTIADQVSTWKNSRGLTDEAVKGHSCSGNTCSYTQIGDAYICEKTGRVHVCDDACREFVLDQSSGLLLCTISGHCFERWLCPDDEWDADDTFQDLQQAGAVDEAEPFMGSGRYARAIMLGYNCTDEKELEDALGCC